MQEGFMPKIVPLIAATALIGGSASILLIVLTVLSGRAAAEDKKPQEIVAHNGIAFSSIDEKSKAVIAYDTVAAYDEHTTKIGDCDRFQTPFKGVLWCFANADNLKKFVEAAKERKNNYVPFGGGYCARGLSNGNFAEGDPLTHVRAGEDLIVNGSWEVADDFWNDAERRGAARVFYKVAIRTGLIVLNEPASK
jgi:hypothetical protein